MFFVVIEFNLCGHLCAICFQIIIDSLALLEFLQDAGDEVEVDEDGDILVPRTKNKLEIGKTNN